MDLDRISSLLSRLATAAAAIFAALALLEWLANLFQYTVLRNAHAPGRLLEIAAILMVFVLAVLLRQVRNALRTGRT